LKNNVHLFPSLRAFVAKQSLVFFQKSVETGSGDFGSILEWTATEEELRPLFGSLRPSISSILKRAFQAVISKGRKMDKEWKEATGHGDLEKVRLLLENGADINSNDGHGQTALMNAAHAGQVELVRLLIEAGADLNITAKYNLSALMLALIAHHTEVAPC
jgi:Ankyrin repeats (many copies)